MFGMTGCLLSLLLNYLMCKDWPWLPSTGCAQSKRGSARLLDKNTTTAPRREHKGPPPNNSNPSH